MARAALHDTVAEPLPMTLPGLIAWHVSPDVVVSVNETVLVKLLTAVTVIVDVAV